MTKLGRNDPCPCGSGKKYKKCCFAKASPVTDLTWQKMRRTEGTLVPILLEFSIKRYGKDAIFEAWDEFSDETGRELKEKEPPLEFEAIFMPWFLFNWIPDKFEESQADYPEQPIASLYLEEKKHQLDSFQQRFIKAAIQEQFSFFVVTDVIPGKSLALKDLFLKKSLSVHERQGSKAINTGSILFARVVTLDNSSIMFGCAPLIIPGTYHPYFIDLRDNWQKALKEFGDEFLLEFDYELREIYYEIKDQVYNPKPPQLVNTEGDPLQMTQLYYTLHCSPREAFDGLKTLATSVSEKELFDASSFNDEGELVSIKVPWLEKTGSEKMMGQTTLKGNLKISIGKLTIDVNSQSRADTVKRKISRRLGKQATFKNAIIQSMEKMMETVRSGNSRAAPSPSELKSKELQSDPKVQAMLKSMAVQHWKSWLDSPLPALKGKTPYEAAKTAKGRERLEAVFLHFEGMCSDNASELFEPDIDALKGALGMSSNE